MQNPNDSNDEELEEEYNKHFGQQGSESWVNSITNLSNTISGIESTISNNKLLFDALTKNVEQMDEELKKTNSEINQNKSNVSTLENKIKELNEKIEILNKEKFGISANNKQQIDNYINQIDTSKQIVLKLEEEKNKFKNRLMECLKRLNTENENRTNEIVKLQKIQRVIISDKQILSELNNKIEKKFVSTLDEPESTRQRTEKNPKKIK